MTPNTEKKTPKPPERTVYTVKPNPMFPPETAVLIRFIRYSRPVKCLSCGKTSAKHWTCLCPFQAADLSACMFTVDMGPRVYQPGESVCVDCLTQPIKAVRDLYCDPESAWWSELGRMRDEHVAQYLEHQKQHTKTK